MGIVQTQQCNSCYLQKIESFRLTPNSFPKKTTLSNGLSVVRLESNANALLYSKAITNSSQKAAVQKWTRTNFTHICGIIKYELSSLPFICGIHLHFNALVEYGDKSLSQLLSSKISNQTDRTIVQQVQNSDEDIKGQNFLRILEIIKFMIQSTEELHKFNGDWVGFHTSNILYFDRNKAYKYLYWPQFDRSSEREAFFDPEMILTSKKSQASTLFSIGMVIMSLLLNEDCSDCYDYRHFSFCRSVFQEKKQKVEELTDRFLSKSCSYTRITSTLEEQIAILLLSALEPVEHRVSFGEFKKKYFQLLRKLSANCQNDGIISTKRLERNTNSNMRRSMAIKRTVPRRFGQGKQNSIYLNLNQCSDCISQVGSLQKNKVVQRTYKSFSKTKGQGNKEKKVLTEIQNSL